MSVGYLTIYNTALLEAISAGRCEHHTVLRLYNTALLEAISAGRCEQHTVLAGQAASIQHGAARGHLCR